jgi:hypothetical protein
MLALVGFLMLAVGFPVLRGTAPDATNQVSSNDYPCASRPCGCGSALRCWTTCRCFTPAERVVWALTLGKRIPEYAVLPPAAELAAIVERFEARGAEGLKGLLQEPVGGRSCHSGERSKNPVASASACPCCGSVAAACCTPPAKAAQDGVDLAFRAVDGTLAAKMHDEASDRGGDASSETVANEEEVEGQAVRASMAIGVLAAKCRGVEWDWIQAGAVLPPAPVTLPPLPESSFATVPVGHFSWRVAEAPPTPPPDNGMPPTV